jgi:hypothetical protein
MKGTPFWDHVQSTRNDACGVLEKWFQYVSIKHHWLGSPLHMEVLMGKSSWWGCGDM